MMKIGVGMIGLGTVGKGTASVLLDNKSHISMKSGMEIELVNILVSDVNKDRPGLSDEIKNLITGNPDDIFNNEDIVIIIEVMGGIDGAFEYIEKALESGRHVVTANKDLMASRGNELFEIAEKNDTAILFEASVCAAIPVVDVIKRNLAGNKISRIMGILNGTTNYILSKMNENKGNYEECLSDAMEKGYAESNPESDVMGYDAARKIAILASIAFNMRINYDDVLVEGITGITEDDMEYAAKLGYVIKLIADAKFEDEGAQVRVSPMFMPGEHPLSKVSGVYNAVYIESDRAGETMLYGKGAGSDPTASAVVGDIISIASFYEKGPDALTCCTCFSEKKLISHSDSFSHFYIRMNVRDNPGVLSKISGVLGEHEVSIYSVVQNRTRDNSADIVIISHSVMERNLYQALEELGMLEIVNTVNSVIRVEDEE